ncbi:hypothetical protein Ae201684P_010306 [Aphanomyces euteiches]|nr:hypothetical protein Ae201684P_010306 [Aphanomyces euteiches]
MSDEGRGNANERSRSRDREDNATQEQGKRGRRASRERLAVPFHSPLRVQPPPVDQGSWNPFPSRGEVCGEPRNRNQHRSTHPYLMTSKTPTWDKTRSGS